MSAQFSFTQHAEPLKAVQSKSAPGMEDMRKLIEEHIIKKTLEVLLNPTREGVSVRSKDVDSCSSRRVPTARVR